MKSFVVLFGQNVPGRLSRNYEIFDIITIKDCDDLEESMRNYVMMRFMEKGKSEKNLDDNLYCRRRNLYLADERLVAERIKVFDHESSNEFMAFVPLESFCKFDAHKY